MHGQQILQSFLGQFDGNWKLVETGEGDYPLQGAFQLAHIGPHLLGDEEGGTFIQAGLFQPSLVKQDGNAHFQLGRLKHDGETPTEA